MDDSTEGDTKDRVLYLGLLAILQIFFIAGLVTHSFIIVININDWWKGRLMTVVDQIVTSLGISRISTQCSITVYLFVVRLFLRHLFSQLALVIMDAVYAFFAYVNIWLTSLLSIVFCLKIANSQTRLFLYLKRMMVQRAGYCIAASVLFSFFICLLPLLIASTEEKKGGSYNATTDSLYVSCAITIAVYNYTLGAFIPLIFYIISSVLLFTSLYLHTTRMKMSGNLTINLGTYYSVMKLVFFTFIYNTTYSTGHLVSLFYYYFYCTDLAQFHVVLEFLPVLHSSYLIYRTAKLRSQMSRVFQSVSNFLFQRKGI